MDDLIAFITARLDEDQAFAMSAAVDVKRLAGRANWSAELAPIVIDAEDPEWAIVDLSPFVEDECVARHIARHDPARVLREVAAKRLIVKLHDRVHSCPVVVPVSNPEAFAEGMYISTEYVDGEDLDVSPCTTLRALAAAWSDHPDYRQEWKP